MVQLSLQPHSRRLATHGLRTINFCLCLTVIGHHHHLLNHHIHIHKLQSKNLKVFATLRFEPKLDLFYKTICGFEVQKYCFRDVSCLKHNFENEVPSNITSKGGNSAYVLFIGTSVAQLGEELAELHWDFRFYLLIIWQVIVKQESITILNQLAFVLKSAQAEWGQASARILRTFCSLS